MTMSALIRQIRGILGRSPAEGNKKKKRPFLLSIRSHRHFILGVVCLAVFTDIFFYGLIVPVIPYSLTEQAGVAEDQVQQWTAILLACYSVAWFLGSPVAGFYADHTESRRGPMLLGLFALGGSTIMLCLGRSVAVLAVGRVLQGLSAAVVWSVGLALLADTVGRDIGVSMGYVSIAMSMGLLVSPLIGGVVYAKAGYYAVFYVAFGLISLDIALRLLLIEKRVAATWIDQDGVSPVVAAAGVGGPQGEAPEPSSSDDTTAVNNDTGEKSEKTEEGDQAPVQPPVQPSTDTPCVMETTTQPVGKPTLHPIVELIKSKRMLAALGGVVMQSVVMFAFDTVVPLFVKDTFHWDSTAAGLIFLAIFVPGFAAPLVGMVSDRHGAKWPSLAGFVVSIPLLVCMRFVTESSVGHKVLFAALLALLGFTLTLSNTPLMAEITYAIEDEGAARPGVWGEKGVFGAGYGLWCTAFALGGTLGSLMAGYVVAGPGWGTFTWSISLWCVVGAAIVFFWVGRNIQWSKKPVNGRMDTEEGRAA